MRFSLHLLPVLIVSFVLCSCGGGSSDATSPGPSTTSRPGNSTPPPQANQNPPPAVGASNSFAYVMNGARLSAFKIDGTTGNLTFVGTLLEPAGLINDRIAVHPSGKFAYVTHVVNCPNTCSPGPPDITAYRINADGTFTAVDTLAGLGGCCIAVHPSGNFFYVLVSSGRKLAPTGAPTDIIEYTVVTYAIDASTGALTLVGETSSPIPFNFLLNTPSNIVIDPSGRFAYFVIFGWKPGAGTILTYTIDSANGIFTPVAAPRLGGDRDIFRMILHPSGKFAYADAYFSQSNACAHLLPDAPTCSSEFFDPNFPIGSYGIQPYTIADTGAPTEARLPLITANLIRFMAVEPSGRFLYSVGSNQGSTADEVSGYIINPVAGTLTPMGPPLAAGPLAGASISMDPGGKFVYVLNHDSDTIYAYAIDPVTGSLTPSAAPVSANTSKSDGLLGLNYFASFITVKVSN
jgi:6-phosphogluconolactonase (cycloisomerase 2 family)